MPIDGKREGDGTMTEELIHLVDRRTGKRVSDSIINGDRVVDCLTGEVLLGPAADSTMPSHRIDDSRERQACGNANRGPMRAARVITARSGNYAGFPRDQGKRAKK
jgi:hypothetical protein